MAGLKPFQKQIRDVYFIIKVHWMVEREKNHRNIKYYAVASLHAYLSITKRKKVGLYPDGRTSR